MSYKDKDWLRSQYQDHTQEEIAEKCSVSRTTIARWLQKHGIETRSRGAPQAEGKYKNKAWLDRKYRKEMRSMADIAAEFGVSKETIKYWLQKHNIPIRGHGEAAKLRVEEHPNTIPDNSQLHPTIYQRRGYEIFKCGINDEHVEHHRLLATLLVDDLSELDGMHVHHENGIKWDNRLSNIEILTPSEHTTLHHEQR